MTDFFDPKLFKFAQDFADKKLQEHEEVRDWDMASLIENPALIREDNHKNKNQQHNQPKQHNQNPPTPQATGPATKPSVGTVAKGVADVATAVIKGAAKGTVKAAKKYSKKGSRFANQTLGVDLKPVDKLRRTLKQRKMKSHAEKYPERAKSLRSTATSLKSQATDLEDKAGKEAAHNLAKAGNNPQEAGKRMGGAANKMKQAEGSRQASHALTRRADQITKRATQWDARIHQLASGPRANNPALSGKKRKSLRDDVEMIGDQITEKKDVGRTAAVLNKIKSHRAKLADRADKHDAEGKPYSAGKARLRGHEWLKKASQIAANEDFDIDAYANALTEAVNEGFDVIPEDVKLLDEKQLFAKIAGLFKSKKTKEKEKVRADVHKGFDDLAAGVKAGRYKEGSPAYVDQYTKLAIKAAAAKRGETYDESVDPILIGSTRFERRRHAQVQRTTPEERERAIEEAKERHQNALELMATVNRYR